MWVDGDPQREVTGDSVIGSLHKAKANGAGRRDNKSKHRRMVQEAALTWSPAVDVGGKGGPFREQGAGGREDAVTEGASWAREGSLSGQRHLHHICMLGRGRNDEEKLQFLFSLGDC